MFDARPLYWLSCKHISYMSPTLNLFNSQFAAETASVSCISITVLFFWIVVCPAFVYVFILFDEILHSGTYVGTRGGSQAVIGSYFRGLWTSTWSARLFLYCHLPGSLKFHDSFRFSHSTFYRQLVEFSMSGGLTTGSSRQGLIAQHKASSNR